MSTKALAALSKPARSYERPGLSVDEIEEIREAFKLFDADGSGTIDPRELKEAMQSLGLEAKSGQVFSMIAAFDADTDKRLDFEEFLELMTSKIVSAYGGHCASAFEHMACLRWDGRCG